jgi:arginine decarboxylase-like protein
MRGLLMAVDIDVEHWSTADAADLYEVARWGNGYFSVGSNGHLLVHPDKNPGKSVDLSLRCLCNYFIGRFHQLVS